MHIEAFEIFGHGFLGVPPLRSKCCWCLLQDSLPRSSCLAWYQFCSCQASFSSGLLGGLLAKTAFLDGAVGAITGTVIWLRGLSYVARPSIPRRTGRLQRLSFPAGLTQAARDHLSLNIYWYSRIPSAIIFAAIYPWWFLFVVLASVHSNSSTTNSGSSQITPPLLALFFFLLALSITMIPASLVARPIELRMISARVCEELCLLLSSAESGPPSIEMPFSSLIVDPLGRFRSDLAQIAGHLADTARQLDARQMRGFPPHPISTLLRAVSRSIREFLGNERSLQTSIPDDLTELLGMTLALFGAHHDQSVYDRLAQRVSAFDEHGDADVNVLEKPPGWIAHFLSRTASGIPKMALAVASIATVAAIIIALVLFILHRMNVNDLLHYLR